MNPWPNSPLALIDGFLAGASRIAPEVNAVFFGLLATSVVVVGGLGMVILIFLVRYRRGSRASRSPVHIAEWKFEATWISATTAIFLGFYFWGARIYVRMEEPPAGAAEIDVIGRQWMWDVRHPDGRRELNELHVPVDQAVVLRLTSEDVIHSFAVPAFRLKQDVVPGKTALAWFAATQTGRYPIFCDQYCGTDHSEMNGTVVVMTAADYAAWLAAEKGAGDAVSRGRTAFIRYGCSACHSGNSPTRGPRLEGLAGSLVPIEKQGMVRADDSFLTDSILSPNKQIAAGYTATMPSYQGVVPAGDLLDLVAYLKALDPETPAASPPAKP